MPAKKAHSSDPQPPGATDAHRLVRTDQMYTFDETERRELPEEVRALKRRVAALETLIADSQVARILRLAEQHAPDELPALRADIDDAMASVDEGDLAALVETLCDWEATIEEIADGALHIDRDEASATPPRGVPVDEAVQQLLGGDSGSD